MGYSIKTEEILRKAGWDPKRRVKIENYLQKLLSEKYHVTDEIKTFLVEFGGLTVEHPALRVPNEMDFFHFDTIAAVDGIYREKVETYEQRVEKSLVVVGEAYSNHMVILMATTGEFYAAFDDLLIFLGKDRFEALKSLCEGGETPEIS